MMVSLCRLLSLGLCWSNDEKGWDGDGRLFFEDVDAI